MTTLSRSRMIVRLGDPRFQNTIGVSEKGKEKEISNLLQKVIRMTVVTCAFIIERSYGG